MYPRSRRILAAAILLGLAGCGEWSGPTPPEAGLQAAGSSTYRKVRQAAVAGSFYERRPEDLATQVDRFLADASPKPVEHLRGLICPHAGYSFSGKTAAFGYKLLRGREIDTVIVMAPSHYADFEGASIPDVEAYETPLGMIPLSRKAAELAKLKPFVVNPPCEVRRPSWWSEAPKELPPFGEDTPHSWEHSLEVQLPWLQRTLKSFRLVPIVFGRVEPAAVARSLAGGLDERTLIVASSDLSHYRPYEVAKGLDTTCCRAICSLNVEWTERQEACGKGPILTLIHLAREKGWKAKLLDYRNSGDTSGDKSRVVGYAAIAFFDPRGRSDEPEAARQPAAFRYPADQRTYLLDLARRTVTGIVEERKLPGLEPEGVPAELTEPRGCFVTLTKEGRLRGCIGTIYPQRPLYQAIIHAAASAAVADRRFPHVQPHELGQIEIEVSVLSLPRRLEFDSPEELLKKLRPGVDGVVLRVGGKESTYLPQVWEQLPEKEAFLSRLAEKAGLGASDWKSKDARILVYQVEAFHESEM